MFFFCNSFVFYLPSLLKGKYKYRFFLLCPCFYSFLALLLLYFIIIITLVFFKPSELFNVSYIKSNLLFQAYDHNYLIRNLDIGCALASSFSPLFFAFFLSSFLKWTIDFILSIKTIHLWGLVPLLISISSRGETSDRCEKRV